MFNIIKARLFNIMFCKFIGSYNGFNVWYNPDTAISCISTAFSKKRMYISIHLSKVDLDRDDVSKRFIIYHEIGHFKHGHIYENDNIDYLINQYEKDKDTTKFINAVKNINECDVLADEYSIRENNTTKEEYIVIMFNFKLYIINSFMKSKNLYKTIDNYERTMKFNIDFLEDRTKSVIDKCF